jgi:hypothetical protein
MGVEMDWNEAQLAIVPALTILFQVLKSVLPSAQQKNIPFFSVALGLVATILWALANGIVAPGLLYLAGLQGLVYGGAAVGLYEMGKRLLSDG